MKQDELAQLDRKTRWTRVERFNTKKESAVNMCVSSREVPRDQVIFATASYDNTIRFWTAHNGQCQKSVQHPDSQVNALTISPDRKMLAAAGFQHIRIYDIPGTANPNPICTYERVPKNITAVGFQEDMNWMYSGGEDGIVRIWDLRQKNTHPAKQYSSTYDCSSPVNCVSLHPNQIELISGDQSGKLHVWDMRNDKKESYLTEKDVSIQSLDIEQETNWLAAVDNAGSCFVYQLKPGSSMSLLEKKLKFSAHKKYALKCKFSPDCTLLVTTSADTTAKIWLTANLLPLSVENQDEASPQNGQYPPSTPLWPTLEDLKPHFELTTTNQRWVWDVAFTIDSQYVITGSSDNMARLWQTNTGDMIREYKGHKKAITAIAFSDGVASH